MTSVDYESDEDEERFCKLVLLGDTKTGKTSLLWRFASNRTFEDFIPEYRQNWTITKKINDTYVSLDYWDTPVQWDMFDKLKPLTFRDCSIIILCFDLTRSITLQNIYDRWIAEVEHYKDRNSDPIIILMGLKSDLLSNRNNECLELKELKLINNLVEDTKTFKLTDGKDVSQNDLNEYKIVLQSFLRQITMKKKRFKKTIKYCNIGLLNVSWNNYPNDIIHLILKYCKYSFKKFKVSSQLIESKQNKTKNYCNKKDIKSLMHIINAHACFTCSPLKNYGKCQNLIDTIIEIWLKHCCTKNTPKIEKKKNKCILL